LKFTATEVETLCKGLEDMVGSSYETELKWHQARDSFLKLLTMLLKLLPQSKEWSIPLAYQNLDKRLKSVWSRTRSLSSGTQPESTSAKQCIWSRSISDSAAYMAKQELPQDGYVVTPGITLTKNAIPSPVTQGKADVK